MKQIVIAVAAAAVVPFAAAAIHADGRPIARLVGVSGNVLVSNDFEIASAGEALRLVRGMRVIATTNSSATVEYLDGCRVKVAAGERVEVRDGSPCGARAKHGGVSYAPVMDIRR
jgi:hypothetical protein